MVMHSKVSFRLGVVFGLIIFFTIALSYIYQGRQLRDLFVKTVRNDLQRELALSRELLREKPPGWQDVRQADAWADRAGSALDVRVTLIDSAGKVIGDSYIDAGRLAPIPGHLGRPEVASALQRGFGENVRFSETVGEEMLYMAVPLGSPRPYAVLRFAKPLHDIRMIEAEVRKGIEGGLFWAVLLALLVGILSSAFLFRPLERIADSADRFLHGETPEPIAAHHRRDEIGNLARAFTFMSEEIRRMSRQEEWFREVIASIRESIIVTNAAGDIVLVNPSASRLFAIEGAMSRSLPVKKIADRAMKELLEKLQASPSRHMREELSLKTTSGERVLKVSAVPVMKDRHCQGTVIVINDITRLRNLEKVRREFVASVSHELRTPLASIRGYTETLLEGAMNDPEHAAGFLRIILQESEQLAALVNDVLDLSKIEAGKIDYCFEAVSIREVADKTALLFSPSVEKKRIRMDVTVPENLPPVLADRNYLEIVMRNLVDNAVKNVDEGQGRIRIKAFACGRTVSLEVEDNGTGIPQQDLDRIFERFYRVDKARSRRLGGTGLGLSIVKHIVLAHRGKIEVRSRVNHGSVFTVTLPRASETETPFQPQPPDASGRSKSGALSGDGHDSPAAAGATG
jgi:two-component system phosphate regulon sensor histidine kinase PhoR